MTARQLPGRVEHTRANGPGKRLIDVILAGAALLFIWPLLAVLGLVVRASSAGPALFRQERIGRGKRPFTMLKLRTMVNGADRLVARMLDETGADQRFVQPRGAGFARPNVEEVRESCHNAPLRRSTAGIVFARMIRSPRRDQFSM